MRAGWPGNAILKPNPDGTAALVRTRVTVYTKDTVVPIAGNTIWASRTGAATLGNPFTTALGFPPIFFCNPGQYDVKLEDADNVANNITIPWEAVPGDDIPGPMLLPASVTLAELGFDPATQAELDTHLSDTTDVHGLPDTARVILRTGAVVGSAPSAINRYVDVTINGTLYHLPLVSTD